VVVHSLRYNKNSVSYNNFCVMASFLCNVRVVLWLWFTCQDHSRLARCLQEARRDSRLNNENTY
jgi:hypothetical protein